MYRKIIATMMLAASSWVSAHEMTPTYPKLNRSYIEGVYVTTMNIFNKRKDVEYYEIGVFDEDFNALPFVSSYEVYRLKYLEQVSFKVYVREKDLERAYYVCSKSKLRKEDKVRTAIASRICSKFVK